MNTIFRKMKPNNDVLIRHPSMKIVENALLREIFQMLILGGISFAIGMLLIFFGWYGNVFLTICGVLLIFFSVFMVFQYQKLKEMEQMPVLRILKQDREKIVWVYPFITEVSPFGIAIFRRCYVIFKLKNGEEISFRIKPNEKQQLLHWLKRLLPHAAFGFSNERYSRYDENPEEFLN